MWAVLILGAGVAGLIGRPVLRLTGDRDARLIALIMLVVGVLPGFMSGVGVAALMLPLVVDIAWPLGGPSLLLPMLLASASLWGWYCRPAPGRPARPCARSTWGEVRPERADHLARRPGPSHRPARCRTAVWQRVAALRSRESVCASWASGLAFLVLTDAAQEPPRLKKAPHSLMMAVAVSACAGFLSHVGNLANVLVMGAGGYRFADDAKAGVPLTLVVLLMVVIDVPIFSPFSRQAAERSLGALPFEEMCFARKPKDGSTLDYR